ncbi:MAG: T9SS type A sorting domain-containing protein [candidate division Zixibacteria bacterium]|nr:T9SS type A sorting domain-containing protein [candidate division Zixibacteria bacterium]
MNTTGKALLLIVIMIFIYNPVSAQTGAWIDHAYEPFGSGLTRTTVGSGVIGYTYENADKILFFDINNSRWLEVEFPSTQYFHVLISEGDLAFAFTDSFVIAYNGINGSCSYRGYEGTPLNIDHQSGSYACGTKLAMLITDMKMYIFDIELDSWQVYDYTLPANYNNDGYYWINDDYAAVILNCDAALPPTNLAYSLQVHSFSETPEGAFLSSEISQMDNGFAGMYSTGVGSNQYAVGYSAASNEFSSINVPTDHTFGRGGGGSYSYVEEFTIFAAKSSILITPYELVRYYFYCYDTRLGDWATMSLDIDPTEDSPPCDWRYGGRFAACFTAWDNDDDLRTIYIYSGYSGDINVFNPGIFNYYNSLTLQGENVFVINDTLHAWAYNAETGESSLREIERQWDRNFIAGKDFLTFSRWDTNEDSSEVYIYYGPDNEWRIAYLEDLVFNNSCLASPNVFAFPSYSDIVRVNFYSPIRDEYVIQTFPSGSQPGLYVNNYIAVGAYGDQTSLFDARTAQLHQLGINFSSGGVGENAVISANMNTNTLYGYSGVTGNVTELQTAETPHTTFAKKYVGLAYITNIFNHFYMFNSYHDSWVELDLSTEFVQGTVGGKTALLYTDEILYAFDPEAPITGVDEDDENQNIPFTFNLDQNYPNPFNANTAISYTIPGTSEVKLDVYNLLGRKVQTLVNKRQTAGEHKVTWNAGDFSSGIYFYKLTTGDNSLTRKMVLLK